MYGRQDTTEQGTWSSHVMNGMVDEGCFLYPYGGVECFMKQITLMTV